MDIANKNKKSTTIVKYRYKEGVMKKLSRWITVIGGIFTLIMGVLFVVNRYEKLISDMVLLDSDDFDA